MAVNPYTGMNLVNTWDPQSGLYYDQSGNEVSEEDFYRQKSRQFVEAAGGQMLTPAEQQKLNTQGSAGLSAPHDGWSLYNTGNGFAWVQPQDVRFQPAPQHNDSFLSTWTPGNDATPEMHGGALVAFGGPLLGAAGTAIAAGAGAGAGGGLAGDAALAGGGEVGSGYAASAPGWGAGEVGGTAGSGTLTGSTANDTLGTSQGNNSMWDLVNNVGYDPGGEGMYTAPSSNPDPYGLGVDQYGNPTNQYAPSTFQGGQPDATNYGQTGLNYQQLAQKYGPQLAQQIIKAGLGAGGGSGGTVGGGILGTLGSDPLQAGFNSLPFLLAMQQANAQGNQVDPIIARMSGLADTAASNTNGLVASAVDPYNKQTMAGRDALMADQSARGIRGSSFGDQGITNYDTTRSMGLGDLTASTQAKSLGLQGGLLDSVLKGTTNAATSKNLLIGAGLSASGGLFKPQNDPFGLANLLALGGQ